MTTLDQQRATTQIHRFRNTVALSVGDGGTVYVSPSMARTIANQLEECAMDVDVRKFGASQFELVEITQDPDDLRPTVLRK